MTNLDQVAMLQRNITEWNQWRIQNPDIPIDLSDTSFERASFVNADLHDADLHNSILSNAFLNDANLNGANLSDAKLFHTNFSNADLSDATFVRVDMTQSRLVHANLSNANLSNANLSEVNLSNSILKGTNLTEVNFKDATFAFTIIGNVDLRRVQGLETIWHAGPSTLGLDTVYSSKGRIPDIFLRNCGMSDESIRFIHAYAGAIQYYSVFMCYNNLDNLFVSKLYTDLQNAGVRCWKYTDDMEIGGIIHETVHHEIAHNRDKLLLVLSQNSIHSDWVKFEVGLAREREERTGKRIIFPIRIDYAYRDATPEWARYIRKELNVGDFIQWPDPIVYQKSFEHMLRHLEIKESETGQ